MLEAGPQSLGASEREAGRGGGRGGGRRQRGAGGVRGDRHRVEHRRGRGHKFEKMQVDEGPKTTSIEITIDSGAGASCWPSRLLKKIPMHPKDKGVRFKAANGMELKYYGTKNVKFQAMGEGAFAT